MLSKGQWIVWVRVRVEAPSWAGWYFLKHLNKLEPGSHVSEDRNP